MITHLYRHFDKEHNLLYVGISLSTIQRLSQHRTNAEWFGKIADITIESFSTREEAIQAETLAIKAEKPIFNIIHNKRSRPRSRLAELEQWLADLIAERPSIKCKSRWHFERSATSPEERKLFEELWLHRVAKEIKRNPQTGLGFI